MKTLIILFFGFPVSVIAQLIGQQPLPTTSSPSFSSIELLEETNEKKITNVTSNSTNQLLQTFQVKESELHELVIRTIATIDSNIGTVLIATTTAVITREVAGVPIISFIDTEVRPPGIPGIITPIHIVVNGNNIEIYDKGKASTNIVWINTIYRNTFIYYRTP